MKILKNFFKILLLLVLIELIFGNYHLNFNKFKLNSERNVLRVYDLRIDNYTNISTYYRDNNAFRTKKNYKIDLDDIETIYLGGTLANQRFLNYEDTIVNFLNIKAQNEKFLHAAIDGVSIIGFLNSFDMWFKELGNLKPRQIIIFFDPDYSNLILDTTNDTDKCNLRNNHRDYFVESTFRENFHWFLEANSTWVYFARRLKEYVYFKLNFEIGAKKVGKKLVNKFDGPRQESILNLKIFEDLKLDNILGDELFFSELYRTYWNIKNFEDTNHFVICYQKKLKDLIDLSKKKKIKPIFVSPVNGGKKDFQVILMNRIIKKFSLENNIQFINIFENLNFEEDDFFSYNGLTKKGSRKVSEYIYESIED